MTTAGHACGVSEFVDESGELKVLRLEGDFVLVKMTGEGVKLPGGVFLTGDTYSVIGLAFSSNTDQAYIVIDDGDCPAVVTDYTDCILLKDGRHVDPNVILSSLPEPTLRNIWGPQ